MILNGFNLSKEYERRGKKFSAVKKAEIFAWSGDFIVIFGESGSGKSTLLSELAGIGEPTSGSVELDGLSLFKLDDEQLSELRNGRIGYIPQTASTLPHFTAIENVLLGVNLYNRKVNKAYVDELLETLGIAHVANEYPENLSGGELRRVAIARALVNNPDLIIADEPTSSLDVDNARKVYELFSKLAKSGKALVVATHDRSILRYGDRVYNMKAGVLTPDINEFGSL